MELWGGGWTGGLRINQYHTTKCTSASSRSGVTAAAAWRCSCHGVQCVKVGWGFGKRWWKDVYVWREIGYRLVYVLWLRGVLFGTVSKFRACVVSEVLWNMMEIDVVVTHRTVRVTGGSVLGWRSDCFVLYKLSVLTVKSCWWVGIFWEMCGVNGVWYVCVVCRSSYMCVRETVVGVSSGGW